MEKEKVKIDDTTFLARNLQSERSKTLSNESSFEQEANNQIKGNISEKSTDMMKKCIIYYRPNCS